MGVKQLFPLSVRRALGDLFGLTKLHRKVHHLEHALGELTARLDDLQSFADVLESDGRLWETSRRRWRDVAPDEALTWGEKLTGDAFIDKVLAHAPFGDTKVVLELGPGYGRLLRSMLDRKVPFARYVGLDISEKNVRHLAAAFASERVAFVHGDAEHADPGVRFDVFLSSLTMKHLYPTFAKALGNLSRYANPGCRFFFDLIEGTRKRFEVDRCTYVRLYTRDEVRAILAGAGLEPVGFGEVVHAPGYARLLVVARKPG